MIFMVFTEAYYLEIQFLNITAHLDVNLLDDYLFMESPCAFQCLWEHEVAGGWGCEHSKLETVTLWYFNKIYTN